MPDENERSHGETYPGQAPGGAGERQYAVPGEPAGEGRPKPDRRRTGARRRRKRPAGPDTGRRNG